MIKVVVFATLAACVLAQSQRQSGPLQPGPPNPPEASARAQVVSFRSSPSSGNGEYSFEYELSDGSYRQETGTLQRAGTPDEFVAVQGVYRWTTPEGWVWETRYSADDNGYHAENVLLGGGGLSPGLTASLVG